MSGATTASATGIVPTLRFPEFEGAWEEQGLGAVCDVRDGTHASPTYVAAGFPLVTSKNLRLDGSLDLENVSLISSTDYEEVNRRSKVHIGDILFGMIGTIGNPVLLKNDGFAIKNVALIKQMESLQTAFLIYVLRGQSIARQFHVENVGGTQKFIGLSTIRSLAIGFPSLPEQKKIAAFLGVVDAKLTALRDRVALLERYKRGLMQALFNQSLRFTKPDGTAFPDWEEKRLGELAVIKTGSRDTQNREAHGAYPFFVRSDTIEQINSFAYDGEAILTSGDGVGVGRNFHYINGKFDYHQRVYAIYGFEEGVRGDYIFAYFSSHFLRRVMRLSAKNSVDSVRMSMISDMPIPLPHPDEQQKIADALSALDAKIAAVADQVAQMEQFKKGLLQQMFV